MLKEIAGQKSTTRPFMDYGLRLRAARLVSARYMVSALVAELGLNDASYRAAEAGRRRLSGATIDKVCMALQVRPTFLTYGSVETVSEESASRIADILVRLERQGIDQRVSDLHQRLRWHRAASGYASAHAAARANGLSVSRYGAHEQGRRPIPVDQMFLYAKVFGADPEALILETGSSSSTQLDVQEAKHRLVGTPVNFPWPWIDEEHMAILQRKRRRFHHRTNGELAVHSGLVAACGIVEKSRSGSRLHLIAHPDAGMGQQSFHQNGPATTGSVTNERTWLICDGVALRQTSKPNGTFRDPLEYHGTTALPVLLGRLLATVQI